MPISITLLYISLSLSLISLAHTAHQTQTKTRAMRLKRMKEKKSPSRLSVFVCWMCGLRKPLYVKLVQQHRVFSFKIIVCVWCCAAITIPENKFFFTINSDGHTVNWMCKRETAGIWTERNKWEWREKNANEFRNEREWPKSAQTH